MRPDIPLEETTNTPSSRLPSLDGWRAVAILFVLLAHSTLLPGFPRYLERPFYWMVEGSLGVRIFFCISGFLITYLLLREARRHRGRINLPLFYLRRCLRILPVYLVFCGALALLSLAGLLKLGSSDWLGILTFTRNYLGENAVPGHLWSLAVEVQFYLLWPPLLVYFLVRGKLFPATALLLVPVVLCPVVRVLSYVKFYPDFLKALFSPVSSFMLIDIPAYGCLAALVFFYAKDSRKNTLLQSRLLFFTGTLLLLIPHLIFKSLVLGILSVPLGYSFQSLGIVILVIQSFSPRNFLFPLLNCRLFVFLGTISYSLYIWQQPFFYLHAPTIPSFEFLQKTPWWIPAVLASGALSYWLIEKPAASLHSRLNPDLPDSITHGRA